MQDQIIGMVMAAAVRSLGPLMLTDTITVLQDGDAIEESVLQDRDAIEDH